MCGICGTAGFVDVELLRRMTSVMTHRGPDDHGVHLCRTGQVGLGNQRLSIIDLSAAGHMPMSNEDGTIHVTHNGEIYNFKELRGELERRGHAFRSHTDTEVVVHGYEEWGAGLLDRLNGMFAFAVLDTREVGRGGPPTLFLARDHLGVKPLYYTVDRGRLLFASEIKCLLQDPRVPRQVNLRSMHRYLSFRWVPGPETMFEGIYKLLPGHTLVWREGDYRVAPYWDLQFRERENGRRSEADLVRELREILARAVERQLVADVPLGVFLSGGLDSSAILAFTAKATGQPVKAYTIAYRPEDGALEQSTDDPKYARMVAETFGADYHEIVMQPEVASLLPKVVWHLDEPVSDAAAISTYLICEAARGDLKVLLSGQGADEIFGGYRIYWTHGLANMLARIPEWAREGGGRRLLGMLPRVGAGIPGAHPGMMLAAQRFLGKLMDGAALTPEERFVFYRSYYTDDQLRGQYSPQLRDHLEGFVAGQRHLDYFGNRGREDFLNRMLYVDTKTFLPELNLTYADKLSAACSLEVRVPLIDREVVDFMASVPPALKLKRLTSKYLFKQAMRGILPDPVIDRRKAAFGGPVRAWMRNELREMVDDLLSEEAIRRRGYFEPAAVQRLIRRDREGIEDGADRLWALLTLEVWHRTFIDAPILVG